MKSPGGLRAAAWLVAGIMLFSGLGSLALMKPDEGRNSEVAREMAATGSWLVPTLEGHPYLDKPAAYFAAVALSLKVIGNNEWGARLPSALCGLGILVLLYAFTRREYDPATAALAVMVVATSPLFLGFSRIVIMDIALGLCTTAAILAAFVAEAGAQPDRRWHAVGAAAAGLGTLVKGPVGALVPALVLIAFFWADGRPRALRRVFAPRNFLIVLALVLPWFIGLARAHPEFVHYGLVEESFNRFFTKTFNRGQPFWFFGPVFLATLVPWTILFVPMTWAAWKERARLTSADRLFIAWTILVLLFFSLSKTKQPGYILTGVVAAGVLVGRGLGYAWHNRDGRAGRLVAWCGVGLAALAVAGDAWLAWTASHVTGTKLGWLVLIRPQLIAVLIAIAVLGALALPRRRTGFVVTAFVLLPMSLITVGLPGAEAYARLRSSKPLAEALGTLPAGTEIACLESYPAGLSFYLERTLTIIGDDAFPLRSNFVSYWLRRLPSPPATLVSAGAKDAWLSSRSADVLVLAPDGSQDDLAAWIGPRAAVKPVAAGWCGALIPRTIGR
jgi:4-amino-4-deoxy-L-arabinose transferase-like glycosyltransferase